MSSGAVGLGWLLMAACAGLTPACTRENPTALSPQERAAESHASAPKTASDAGQAPGERPHELYSYRDVIAALRKDDSVMPEMPPVHPVHTLYNREAIVPPMCYTRTEGQHNPCYVCHQDRLGDRPNRMDDGDLQRTYSFSDLGKRNHWTNLFEDRSSRVQAISDDEIIEWVSQDNYSELAARLTSAGFKGYIPDLEGLERGASAFDEEGFAKDGSHWVAFTYKPMPSTFWPTNGSTDDVMIRLPEAFRTTSQGEYSRDVYRANLALVEANIKQLAAISVDRLSEAAVGADLNGDGKLTRISRITKTDAFVGAARNVIMLASAFPQHTEFLHSVRYVGVDSEGNVFNPPRMKELRYMRKRWAMSGAQLLEAYIQEQTAKDVGQLPGYVNRGHYGLDNEMGWVVAGFIENRSGRLRVNTYEETLYCMGCHTSIGSTIDSTFSFARKVDGVRGWGYINLRGMPDAPNVGETKGEIASYLERAGGGGEFRSNPEMAERWFHGVQVDAARVAAAKDVYELITPSRQRALSLNKAYRVLVEDQTFLFGREPTVTPPANVYSAVDTATAPTLPPERTYSWDIRLDWSREP